MTCGQLFAALRMVVHADAGREVQRGLVFIQALTEDHIPRVANKGLRPLLIDISALTDAELKMYTSFLNELCDAEDVKADAGRYDRVRVSAREARAWIRGRYARIGAESTNTIFKYFAPNMKTSDTLTSGQLFAALRMVMHVNTGKRVHRGLAFIQALTGTNALNAASSSKETSPLPQQCPTHTSSNPTTGTIPAHHNDISFSNKQGSSILTPAPQVDENDRPEQQKLPTAAGRRTPPNHPPQTDITTPPQNAPVIPTQTKSQKITQRYPPPTFQSRFRARLPPISASRNIAASTYSAPVICDSPKCYITSSNGTTTIVASADLGPRTTTRSAVDFGPKLAVYSTVGRRMFSSSAISSGSVVLARSNPYNSRTHSTIDIASRLRDDKSSESSSSIVLGNTEENFKRLLDCWNESQCCLFCDKRDDKCVLEDIRYDGLSKISCNNCRLYKQACWAPGERELRSSLGITTRGFRRRKRPVPDDTNCGPSQKKARRT
ncbi:hypothetical protein BDQ17DRAFT_1371238 [Cyathus striatus]|nr:hypothetical protein BDQ17DRAFT_1371238 [Cyathus striatus]